MQIKSLGYANKFARLQFVGKSNNRLCPKMPTKRTFLSVITSPITAAFLPNGYRNHKLIISVANSLINP